MWLLFAFTGPVLWAISTHIDKYLVGRYFRDADTTVLILFTALIGVAGLPIIALFQPGILAPSPTAIAVMAFCGMLYIGAILFYLRAIQTTEASVIAPLFQTSILFTVLLAWLVLGEKLGWRQAAGIGLIFAGVLVLSVGRRVSLRGITLRVVMLMLGCGLVLALAQVLFKYFALRDDFWVTTFWNFVGQGVFGLAIFAWPKYRRQFFALFRKNPGAVMGINGANELINLGAGMGVRYASLSAPVALVSAVSSTVTLFVFVFGVLLTLFWPRAAREDLSHESLIRKGISALLVTAGVFLSNTGPMH